jgi:hypothetical protein
MRRRHDIRQQIAFFQRIMKRLIEEVIDFLKDLIASVNEGIEP